MTRKSNKVKGLVQLFDLNLDQLAEITLVWPCVEVGGWLCFVKDIRGYIVME